MEKCKGSRDLLPEDMHRFRHTEEIFRSCCLAWGYQEVRTPTLEYLHLFTATGTLTPGRLSRVYSFLDWDGWSGERVALRPEGTIPAARLYIENIPKGSLGKLFYIENIFSFEESGTESRERWQCGAELIGSRQTAADAELILLAREVLKRLGLQSVELRLSHAGLLRALLKESGLNLADQERALYGVLNGGVGTLEQTLSANPCIRDSVQLLFGLRGKSPGFLKNSRTALASALPGLEPSLEDFLMVAEHLSAVGADYQIDIGSGKGFEYYTGITFQLYCGGQKIGGGGRYDDLIPLLGGGEVPASGFAFDMDRILGLLPGAGTEAVLGQILVQREGDGAQGWAASIEAAALLRKAGYVASLDSGYTGAAPYPWTIRVVIKEGMPLFVLEDRARARRVEASSMEEILKVLQKANEAGAA